MRIRSTCKYWRQTARRRLRRHEYFRLQGFSNSSSCSSSSREECTTADGSAVVAMQQLSAWSNAGCRPSSAPEPPYCTNLKPRQRNKCISPRGEGTKRTLAAYYRISHATGFPYSRSTRASYGPVFPVHRINDASRLLLLLLRRDRQTDRQTLDRCFAALSVDAASVQIGQPQCLRWSATGEGAQP